MRGVWSRQFFEVLCVGHWNIQSSDPFQRCVKLIKATYNKKLFTFKNHSRNFCSDSGLRETVLNCDDSMSFFYGINNCSSV